MAVVVEETVERKQCMDRWDHMLRIVVELLEAVVVAWVGMTVEERREEVVKADQDLVKDFATVVGESLDFQADCWERKLVVVVETVSKGSMDLVKDSFQVEKEVDLGKSLCLVGDWEESFVETAADSVVFEVCMVHSAVFVEDIA